MKTLIIIDMQNDFVTGSLANPAAEAIIPFIMAECESGKYDRFVFTQDTHDPSYLDTQEGKNLPIEHCQIDTDGWEIVPKLYYYATDQNTYTKHQFGNTKWPAFKSDDELFLVGTCTDICVISNALILKAYFPETKITVLAKGCAGLTPEKHAAALEVMKSCQINVEE